MSAVINAAHGRHAQRGFTLAELAIVLIIITILAAARLVPIGGQIESRQRKQTDDALERIEAALIGFAILNRRLPCPTNQTDPSAADYGEEDVDGAGQCVTTAEGMLPWRTLGLGPTDVWGTPRSATTDTWAGHWRYRVDRNFATTSAPGIAPATNLADQIRVVDHGGQPLTATGAEAVALFYSSGADRISNGQNASYEAGVTATYEQGEPTTTFDDMVKWFGRPLLIARMAEAGVF